MADESYSFSTARTRLEEIVSQVRKKDTSLEKSLDLLEEGVRLANACTELIDHQDWVGTTPPELGGEEVSGAVEDAVAVPEAAQPEAAVETSGEDETVVVEGVAVIEDVVISDDDGNFVAEVIEVSEYSVSDDFEDADDAWAEESPAESLQDADDPSAAER
ncbi:MAG: exodeoxyribonuclease VII small subunit [Coriobacteriia bacterium]|nr:exodeoxyribonuclease VII small subunit [Coriobacteriia bacterium]